MLKKVIIMVLSLCMLFEICSVAENAPQGPPPEGFDPSQMPNRGNFDPSQMPDRGNFAPPTDNGNTRTAENTAPSKENFETNGQRPQSTGENMPANGRPPQFNGGERGGNFPGRPGNMQNNIGQTQPEEKMNFKTFLKTYTTPIISVILLVFAYIFVIFYKRKRY